MRMRKMRNLEPRMEKCAAYRIDQPETLRGNWRSLKPDCTALWVEVGCGKGKFTAETAQANPDVLLIAVERCREAMVVAMEKARDMELKNVFFIDMDVAKMEEIFAPGEIDRLFINFPDPWKKSRQHKRRLTYAGFLALYANVLPLGGEIWFKTDNDPLFAFSLEQFAQEGWELREVTHDLHADGPVGVMTDYEAKFYDQGITINRCVAVKTEDTKCDLYPGTSTGCAPV